MPAGFLNTRVLGGIKCVQHINTATVPLLASRDVEASNVLPWEHVCEVEALIHCVLPRALQKSQWAPGMSHATQQVPPSRAFRLARSVASGTVQPLWLSWMAAMEPFSVLNRSLTVA